MANQDPKLKLAKSHWQRLQNETTEDGKMEIITDGFVVPGVGVSKRVIVIIHPKTYEVTGLGAQIIPGNTTVSIIWIPGATIRSQKLGEVTLNELIKI